MKKLILLLVALGVSSFQAIAQCAMCRASVETNLAEGGNSIGAGINTGILYLLVMPYLIIMIVAFLWYKNSKKYYANLQAKSNIIRKVSSL
jgi:high-affinity nickel permease